MSFGGSGGLRWLFISHGMGYYVILGWWGWPLRLLAAESSEMDTAFKTATSVSIFSFLSEVVPGSNQLECWCWGRDVDWHGSVFFWALVGVQHLQKILTSWLQEVVAGVSVGCWIAVSSAWAVECLCSTQEEHERAPCHLSVELRGSFSISFSLLHYLRPACIISV
jgi:hypothetical protein